MKEFILILVPPLEQHSVAHMVVPNSAPTPAVRDMASAPQNSTRVEPNSTPAPAARAANPPRSARSTSEVTETDRIKCPAGASTVTTTGTAAPRAKLLADASAA